MGKGINRVYTIELARVVPAAGGIGDVTFDILNWNRVCYLKSIVFDLRIQQMVSGQNLPLEQNLDQQFRLRLTAVPVGSLYAQIFENISVPAAAIVGSTINIFKPGQLKWDSFFVQHVLHFEFNYTNNNAAIVFYYIASVVVELEDINFFS